MENTRWSRAEAEGSGVLKPAMELTQHHWDWTILQDSHHRTPSGRITEPSDVANAVLFLASPLASRIHGHTLIVDGGYSIVA
jgi:NAD(P)-dependent dehydrogenase (short-subunit alcohol dehydrogenase family)